MARGLALYGLPDTHLQPASEGRSAPPNQHLFVYGTLLEGEERGWVLYDLGDRGNPVLMPGEGKVYGEVVRLPDDRVLLGRLDQIEGMHAHGAPNNLYRRGFVRVHTDDGPVWVWTYWWNGLDAGEAIASGDWRQR